MTTEQTHAPHAAAPASAGGFKYFLPGLIVGFIIGGVVGVLLPEFVDRGGPRLEAPAGSGRPRVHNEEERLNAEQLPPVAIPEGTVDPAPDLEGTTAPDAPASTPPASGGH